VTRDQLFTALSRAGVQPIQWTMMDEDYNCPTREWVQNEFSTAYWNNLKSLGLENYVSEGNDCDDFARLAWAMASVCNARTQPRKGITFGIFCYVTREDVGHAINVFVTGDGHVRFWEPQTCREVALTPDEISSCFDVII
jgi:hypothetical protein